MRKMLKVLVPPEEICFEISAAVRVLIFLNPASIKALQSASLSNPK
jgi:hypothetical protein